MQSISESAGLRRIAPLLVAFVSAGCGGGGGGVVTVLSGVVLGVNGAPIAGAVVGVEGSGGATVTTAADGSFALSSPDAIAAAVVVADWTHPGGAAFRARSTPLVAAAGASVSVGSLALASLSLQRGFDPGSLNFVTSAPVSVADLNDDGAMDVVFSEPESGGFVGVRLNRGDGSFQPATSYGGGTQEIERSASGDFDGDGATDFIGVFVNGLPAPRFRLFLNDGAGALIPSPDATLEVAGLVSAKPLVAKDLDGDGRSDLVVQSSIAPQLRFLNNDGAGGFTPAGGLTAALGVLGHFLVADFDHDGVADVVVIDPGLPSPWRIDFHRGLGGGEYAAAATTSFPPSLTGVQLFAPFAAALDGDADLDLAFALRRFAPGGGLVTAFVGAKFEGPGFATPAQAAAGSDLAILLTVADFDADGRADLVVKESDATAGLRRNLGDGTTFEPPRTFDAHRALLTATAADFDQDGRPDLLAGVSWPSIHFQGPDGRLRGSEWFGGLGSPDSARVADVNGDGLGDFVTISDALDLVLVRKSVAGGSFATSFESHAVGVGPHSPEIADLDADGDLDLVVCNVLGGTVSVLLNVGGSFGAATTVPVAAIPVDAAVLDGDGDGDLDLAIATNGPDAVRFLLNGGAGGFTTGGGLPAPQSPSAILAADANHDGLTDLVLLYRGGTALGGAVIYVNHGSGVLSPGTPLPSALPHPDAAAIGDVDGDGDEDLMLADFDASPSLELHRDFGVGSTPEVVAFDGLVLSLSLADLDGDDRADLVVGAEVGVATALSDATDGFGPWSVFDGPSVFHAATGDLDGDEKIDVVGAAPSESRCFVYRNRVFR
jgi:hypothetical protein